MKAWRAAHPGYWRRRSGAVEKTARTRIELSSLLAPFALQDPCVALQDSWNPHVTALIGLIAWVRGTALQNVIAADLHDNRLSLIQEHRMIMKALEGGVTEAQIAQALDIDVRKIVLGKNLLEGLHAEAIQILKDKPITARALNILKQVKALRQIEMAQLMVSGSNYTFAYARALLVGTSQENLVKPDEPKKVKGLTAVEISRMEKEMESLERDFRIFQDQFGQNTLHLGAAQRYVRKLLENGKVKKFLQQRHPEILEELLEVAALEAL